jgi:hypothetical protein
MAGIDLLTGTVYADAEDRHRSRDFIGFLKLLNETYPTETAMETKAWLSTQLADRFDSVLTPKHEILAFSLIGGFFFKMTRSMLRHIRVASTTELQAWILTYLPAINREPVIRTWTYRIDAAA